MYLSNVYNEFDHCNVTRVKGRINQNSTKYDAALLTQFVFQFKQILLKYFSMKKFLGFVL